MHLGLYFIFTQLKATLRTRWKEVEVGGERSKDRDTIFLQRCLENLAPCVGLWENTRGETISLTGISLSPAVLTSLGLVK